MEDLRVPFNRIAFESNELENIVKAVRGCHISGDGPFSRNAEAQLAELHQMAKVLLTPSCSHALELAARLIEFEPGDEVIVPSYTFVTSVSSFVFQGALPVFCDIDPITLGLNLERAENLISPRTRAIVLVHYGGVPADPQGFAKLAEKYGLVLIEDNAHGLGGEVSGKPLGTFGAMSTLSFHETKNITCGEGGALVLNDSSLVGRAEILREKGTDRSRFFRGQVDKYTWRDLGSSWVLSDLLSAILYSQLLNFEKIQLERHRRWSRYDSHLASWAASRGYGSPTSSGTAHVYYLVFPNVTTRQRFIRHMRKHGVLAVSHYEPLHQSPYALAHLGAQQQLPVTEFISNGLVRLPISSSLTEEDQDHVISAVLAFDD